MCTKCSTQRISIFGQSQSNISATTMMQNSQAAPVTGAKASAKGKTKVLTLVSKSEDAQHSRKKALKLTVGNTLFFSPKPLVNLDGHCGHYHKQFGKQGSSPAQSKMIYTNLLRLSSFSGSCDSRSARKFELIHAWLASTCFMPFSFCCLMKAKRILLKVFGLYFTSGC